MRIRHVLRRLGQSPVFTTVALLTLAVGIGANTAIFSVINGILLKPLPYSQPDQLIALDYAAPGVTGSRRTIGMAPFLYFIDREQNQTLEDVALWNYGSATVTGIGEPEQLGELYVTDATLPLLRVQPAAGRLFSRQDDLPDRPETVMISYGYWQSKFGGSAAVIGKHIQVDGKDDEIIGVLPRDFWFFDVKPSVVVPMQINRAKTHLGQFSYRGFARLKPGTTIQQAGADIQRLIPVALDGFPPFPGYDRKMFVEARLAPSLQGLKQDVIGDIGAVLWVLMGTIGMVLLIACANVANLLLVRAEGRQQELAIRAALGAGWGRIVGELLLESVTLGVLGGFLGLGLAYAGLRLLVAIAPANLPRLGQISIDLPVLLFTFGISLVSGVLFGLIPAIKYAGPHLNTALRAGGRTASGSREQHRTRNTLVVVQVALALVLLIASGLMIRTFYALKRVHPGFERAETLQTLRLYIPEPQVKDGVQVTRMEQAILDRIAAINGVQSVALTSDIPMTGDGWQDAIYAQDKVYSGTTLPPIRRYKFISPGLIRTMGNRLIAGRDFTWTDLYEKRKVMMVTENLARELWGDPSAALGKQLRESLKAEWREVVGVVSDERDTGVNKPAPATVLFPILMGDFTGDETFSRRSLAYIIRSDRAGSQSLMNEVRQAVWAVNSNLPLDRVRTMQEVYEKSMARTSFTLVMLGIAGGMALLLGVVGIYGVISYSVSQRTREIGIRMALGARQQELLRMFVGHGAKLAAIGVAFGLLAAFELSRLMTALLFGVGPGDPPTYGVVAVFLLAGAMLASYIPALRATAVDPVEALRME